MKQNQINLEKARLRKQLTVLAVRQAKLDAETQRISKLAGAFLRQRRKDARLKLNTVAKAADLSIARLWTLEQATGKAIDAETFTGLAEIIAKAADCGQCADNNSTVDPFERHCTTPKPWQKQSLRMVSPSGIEPETL